MLPGYFSIDLSVTGCERLGVNTETPFSGLFSGSSRRCRWPGRSCLSSAERCRICTADAVISKKGLCVSAGTKPSPGRETVAFRLP